MKSSLQQFLHKERALLLLSLLASGLVFFRIFYLQEGNIEGYSNLRTWPRLRFLFLGWNLILAWVPLGLLYLLPYMPRKRWIQGAILTAWLLFFPNAPYLMTDLIHLRVRPGIPLWFDALLLFTFAYLGLALGIRTLEGLRSYLREHYSRTWANGFTLATLLLSGLGIYLGRVLRWNSWDALLHPQGPILDTLALVHSPLQNGEAWLMILLFTLVFSTIYWSQRKQFRNTL
ncbi:DUF1361 domain-containing protein [Lewinella cohaerens]|uniref:DUF1361 domain-containing protein n=1 Tax=Lewinella cohaerens TaxID=70995 RepID=UPI00036FA34C|nr:DUF1361 domain-containing protein [Lewinella cohaerens]